LRVWDIVRELVLSVSALPCTANAFAVDHDAVATLPAAERAFMTGALIHFLRELGRSADSDDLATLTVAHASALRCISAA
jgi:hypothetical protein